MGTIHIRGNTIVSNADVPALSVADRIRSFLVRRYVQPSRIRHANEITIRAGDVHGEIGFANRMPLVCSVLDGKRFRQENGLELIERTGPRQGSTAIFRFRLQTGDAISIASPTVTKPASQFEVLPPNVDEKNITTVCLISSVGEKRPTPVAAKDLYVSDWFRKARAFAERKRYRWYILSAEYGLVPPEAVIAPYEKALKAMTIRARRAWAERVLDALLSSEPDIHSVIFLAGQRYREFLADALRIRSVQVEIPMEGLRISEQLSWMARS
jgi:hypothetical protein